MSDQITIEELEREATAFLESNARPREEVHFEWGQGPDRVALIPESTPEQDRIELAAAREWSQAVFDAGFGWLTGPPEYGGRGLSREHERRWRELEAQYDTPSQTIFGIGLGMVAPTILAHGNEDVKKRYLASMYRGDIVGCQLFSEPGAGSDLAGLQTRAERDGDEWVVNGQKVWTSFAHLADIGEIICRSDPDAPKHRGLTGFIVDMHAPGVDVRPLRQMTGGASFNEVFFTDVRIPDSHRLGAVNDGWSVALTTLMNERAAIGGGGGGAGSAGTSRLIELVRHTKKTGDPLVRQQLAQLVIHSRVARYTTLRAMARVAAGQAPGPEMSIAKMALTENLLMTCELVSSVLGPQLVADSGEWGTYAWSELVLGVPGMRVAGGTDEVLRNIVGERVLGLPKEPTVR
ncbi:MAG: acyl-CoA dehydrogenase family protein [Actinomycetota bacterium]|jgi:acyl-CoA dehydrogenase|nr:acyl-CoA dehydrogenase family protein [Actinomycetota bacterium]